jgi:hypothetical protein
LSQAGRKPTSSSGGTSSGGPRKPSKK